MFVFTFLFRGDKGRGPLHHRSTQAFHIRRASITSCRRCVVIGCGILGVGQTMGIVIVRPQTEKDTASTGSFAQAFLKKAILVSVEARVPRDVVFKAQCKHFQIICLSFGLVPLFQFCLGPTSPEPLIYLLLSFAI